MGESSIKVVVGKGISTRAWSRDASNDVDEKDIAFAESKGLLAKLAEHGGWSEEDGFIDDAWILLTDADESDLDYDATVVAYATLPTAVGFLVRTRAGLEFGPYDVGSPADALDAMAREAGYKDAAGMAEVTGADSLWTTNAALYEVEHKYDLLIKEIRA